jgi:MFS family permease
VLAAINWHAVFLLSVPFGLFGTAWAYLVLHETATIRAHQRLDIAGNVLFAVGLTLVLVGFTYAIQPYGGSSMGWGNPTVIGEIAGGLALLGVFIAVERRVPDPMFRLELFRIRMFAAGNIAGFLSSLARGGLQLILIVWLQGIWLPLHGYTFEETPLWAAVYMLPMTGGFLLAGPLSGWLSDRFGARYFSTGGMLITAAAFVGFLTLPADFDYVPFALLLLMLGIGMGAFASPNTASIMNAVPPEHRGASSGMRATFQNVASSLSLTLIFTLVVAGLSASLPGALFGRLTAAGIPSGVATQISGVPPVGALFAAFLGYNPMATLLSPSVLAALPSATQATLLSPTFFPQLLAEPFHDGLQIAFSVCVVLSLGAAAASWLRGRRFIHDYEVGSAATMGKAEPVVRLAGPATQARKIEHP